MPRLKPFAKAQKLFDQTLELILSGDSRYGTAERLVALFVHADRWGIKHNGPAYIAELATAARARRNREPKPVASAPASAQERVSQVSALPRRPGL